MSNKQIACWDFTIHLTQKGVQVWKEDEYPLLIKQLKEIAKAGTFQLEEGQKTGKLHFQGRVSMKKRYRKSEIIKLATDNFLRGGIRWSITSNECRGNYDYLTKDHTRVAGPWDITVKPNYIPRQIREIKELRPFQKTIIADADIWNTRHVNWIYDDIGNIGKSILKTYLRAHKIGRPIPPMNDMKDIMRMVCDVPTSKLYIIDLPKAMQKNKLYGMMSAIETIKDGYAYDERHKFKEKVFDCPNIWVFSNTIPDIGLLSNDRWRFWKINRKSHELEPFHTSVEEEETACATGIFGASL